MKISLCVLRRRICAGSKRAVHGAKHCVPELAVRLRECRGLTALRLRAGRTPLGNTLDASGGKFAIVCNCVLSCLWERYHALTAWRVSAFTAHPAHAMCS